MRTSRANAAAAIFTAALVVLVVVSANVCSVESAASRASLDECGHTLRRPSGFWRRHFDGSFMKKFFKHWIPFTGSARVKMQFFLYKRDFAECGRELITDDDEALECSGFNAEHPTRIIIHGWMSQSKGSFNRAVKNAYLSLTAAPQQSEKTQSPQLQPNYLLDGDDEDVDHNRNDNIDIFTTAPTGNASVEDFNVIVVDWSVISSNVNYYGVVDLIEELGLQLAEFVRYLHMRAGLHYDDVYLIGHSLGAQIAGSAGKQVQPFRFNTIFALDPAGPQFRNRSNELRIDPSDATYVESIQTSSSLGFAEPLGHATFYPNYGRDQKNCHIFGCSHSRAYNYFAESITSSKGFWGTLCQRQSEDVWILSDSGAEFRMGGEPSMPKHGTFYVRTADRPPYALGRRRVVASMESTAAATETNAEQL